MFTLVQINNTTTYFQDISKLEPLWMENRITNIINEYVKLRIINWIHAELQTSQYKKKEISGNTNRRLSSGQIVL
jgi:hypothetical protein